MKKFYCLANKVNGKPYELGLIIGMECEKNSCYWLLTQLEAEIQRGGER